MRDVELYLIPWSERTAFFKRPTFKKQKVLLLGFAVWNAYFVDYHPRVSEESEELIRDYLKFRHVFRDIQKGYSYSYSCIFDNGPHEPATGYEYRVEVYYEPSWRHLFLPFPLKELLGTIFKRQQLWHPWKEEDLYGNYSKRV